MNYEYCDGITQVGKGDTLYEISREQMFHVIYVAKWMCLNRDTPRFQTKSL